MLRKRIIPTQLLLDGRLVKTKQFGSPRDVGNPVSSSRVYYANGADELVFLNIDRERRSVAALCKVMDEVSRVLFVPLAAGGGIWNARDARDLINAGADKVVVNTVVYHEKDIIRRISESLGCQAVVVSIDVRCDQGRYRPYSNCGQRLQGVDLGEHIARCREDGAGEFLIQSIDQDGMRTGLDLDLISLATKHAGNVPVVACGGVGTYEHVLQGFQAGVDAVACGSLFCFSDSNPLRAKAYLRNHDIHCRH